MCNYRYIGSCNSFNLFTYLCSAFQFNCLRMSLFYKTSCIYYGIICRCLI